MQSQWLNYTHIFKNILKLLKKQIKIISQISEIVVILNITLISFKLFNIILYVVAYVLQIFVTA